MNWRKYPHLFANSKFKIEKFDPFSGLPGAGETKVFVLDHSNFDELKTGSIGPDEQICTLIARRIEDMTDDEIDEVHHLWGLTKDQCDLHRKELVEKSKNGQLMASEQNFMLSIGVYPFSQSHFETGNEIDLKKVEKS